MWLRREILRRYAMDIFIQLVGSAVVEVYTWDPVFGTELHNYTVCPPIIDTSFLHGIGHRPYRLLNGDNWITAVQRVGLEKTRALFVD